MTIPTHIRGPLQRISYDPAIQRPAAEARRAAPLLATIKRSFIGIVAILAAGTAVAAVIALKMAIYLPHFVHS